MNIEKAIEILDTHQCDMPRNEVPDLIDAMKLGIEALKRIKEERTGYETYAPDLLPGETEK